VGLTVFGRFLWQLNQGGGVRSWLLVAVIIVVLGAQRVQSARKLDWRTHALLLTSLVAPFSVPLWGAIAYAWDEGRRGVPWATLFLMLLAGLTIGVGLLAAYRVRRLRWVAISLTAYIVATTALGWFVGTMMIANDWL
jgi:hypothetical protein